MANAEVGGDSLGFYRTSRGTCESLDELREVAPHHFVMEMHVWILGLAWMLAGTVEDRLATNELQNMLRAAWTYA